MSTTARELEELRKAREEARLQAEEEKRIADEKAAVQAKKNAFLSRAAAFQQKKGPTEDEVRNEVTKNSMKRNFSRKLDKALGAAPPGTNPMAFELGMRGKASHAAPPPPPTGPCDWELITDPDQPPYYYNKVTGESTYDRPEEFARVLPPPPPPPPQKLMGLGAPPPPPPPSKPTVVEEEVHTEQYEEQAQFNEVPTAVTTIGWVHVCVNEPNPYYWNIATNETSFEIPEGFDGTIYTEDMNPATGESTDYSSVVTWQEVVGETGEVYYSNLVDGSVVYERPDGTTFVQVYNEEDGTQVDWQYCADEEGNGYYFNLTTQESTYEAPAGTVMIVINHAE